MRKYYDGARHNFFSLYQAAKNNCPEALRPTPKLHKPGGV